MEDRLGKDGDDLYRELLLLFEGKSREERDALFARLVLALMNEVGDRERILGAFEMAKK